jgi:purine-binding chemotaxis protein CheW
VSGLLELRGNPLPIVDLRAGNAGDAAMRRAARGDVLVLAEGIEAVGLVVDQVTGVHDEEDFVATREERPAGLPHYVVDVLRRGSVGSPVLLVDLQRLVTVAAT